MRVKLDNLGALKKAEFQLSDLTIICGANNTGKTYATYALFGFLYACQNWHDLFKLKVSNNKTQELFNNGVVYIDLNQYLDQAIQIINEACKAYTKQLPKVFAAPSDRFKESNFQVLLDIEQLPIKEDFNREISTANTEFLSIRKNANSTELIITLLTEKAEIKISTEIINRIITDSIKDIIFSKVFPRPFIASAERTGAAIFRKELNFARNRLLEEMSEADKNIDPMELLFKVHQDYALPVEENVDFTRELETIFKKDSFIAKYHPELLEDFADIIGGEYSVTRNDELYYIPKKGKRVKLSMDESSSAVRSLLDIGFYLRHEAQQGDLLMIDEPELNLHPENQRRVARLFARLIKVGIKVFLTTHSDFIIKELNTLIMLNQDKPNIKNIMEKEKYIEAELITSENIKVYIAEEAPIKPEGYKKSIKGLTLTPAKIDPEFGIEARSFDTTIETMNRIQEEIVWG